MSTSGQAFDTFSGRSRFRIRVAVALDEMDIPNNRSKWDWSLRVENPDGSTSTWSGGAGDYEVFVGGSRVANGTTASGKFDFRDGAAYHNIKTGTTGWISHNGTGNLTLTFSAHIDDVPIFGSASASTSIPADRIPQPPTAPQNPAVALTTATSAKLTWSAPANDNGAGVTGYTAQASLSSSFTSPTTLNVTGREATFGPLEPGEEYYFRVAAKNAAGPGIYSGTVSKVIGDTPAAPVLIGVTQVADRTIRALWEAPVSDGGSPLTGYRVQYANNPAFTGPLTVNLGLVDEWTSPASLGPGPWYVRVAALNVVSSASGATIRYSSAGSVTVTGDVGNLDGWTLRYPAPAGTDPITGDGIRRTSEGLAVEFLTDDTITPGTFETVIRRTFDGLAYGKTYRLDVTLTAGAPCYDTTIILGDQGPITISTSSLTTLGYEFIASEPSRVLQLVANTTIPGGAAADEWALNLRISGIRLWEIPAPAPYMLGDTVYEGPLAVHFDYACATRGGAWWVDRENVVRFREYDDRPAAAAHFSDVRAPGVREYIDISAAYDTRNVVNSLTIHNHGRDPLTEDADDADYIGTNTPAIAAWGVREGAVDMTLYDPETFAADRLAEILASRSIPEQIITEIRWNAQEDPALASRLDIQDRVLVTFRGLTQISRVVGIKHDVTPTRWITTLALAKDSL